MPEVIYIRSASGKPLMPTGRKRHITKLLNTGKARIVSKIPFVVQLRYETTEVTQPLYGGTDPGRTNIGDAVMREDGTVVYRDHVKTRNKDVPQLMLERKRNRQASRRGERLARKRLAKKHETLSASLPAEGKHIAGCKKLIPVKDIQNTESRFSNRKRHGYMNVSGAKWVTPTVCHLVRTTLNHVDQICKLLPITGWCFEVNRFAFMTMEDGTVRGTDFQNGRLKGYKSVDEFVIARQDGKCACCGKPMDDNHHIIPVSEGGSDGPENRIGLCEECHHKHHIGELDLDVEGCLKKYGALSVLNQAIPFILAGLTERFGEANVYVCTGKDTYRTRSLFGLPKEHDMDAVAIISKCNGIVPTHVSTVHRNEVMQFRRHDRAVIKAQKERTYYVKDPSARGGKRIVAKNRKPREEQSKSKYPALSQYVKNGGNVSNLLVTPSKRSYNNLSRELHPGDLVNYQGTEYVVQNQITNGQYIRAVGNGSNNIPTANVRCITHNRGLVYVG